MSRVINPNAPGKERNRLKRAAALALRELMVESEPTPKARDLVAFIVLALEGITETVDVTSSAWEKRDYWIKADRFRRDWEWAARLGVNLRKAALVQDWDKITEICVQVFQQVGDEKISQNHRMGTPWIGAWKELTQS